MDNITEIFPQPLRLMLRDKQQAKIARTIICGSLHVRIPSKLGMTEDGVNTYFSDPDNWSKFMRDNIAVTEEGGLRPGPIEWLGIGVPIYAGGTRTVQAEPEPATDVEIIHLMSEGSVSIEFNPATQMLYITTDVEGRHVTTELYRNFTSGVVSSRVRIDDDLLDDIHNWANLDEYDRAAAVDSIYEYADEQVREDALDDYWSLDVTDTEYLDTVESDETECDDIDLSYSNMVEAINMLGTELSQ